MDLSNLSGILHTDFLHLRRKSMFTSVLKGPGIASKNQSSTASIMLRRFVDSAHDSVTKASESQRVFSQTPVLMSALITCHEVMASADAFNAPGVPKVRVTGLDNSLVLETD